MAVGMSSRSGAGFSKGRDTGDYRPFDKLRAGWAQAHSSYGASEEDALERLQYDLYYVKNLSALLALHNYFGPFALCYSDRGAGNRLRRRRAKSGDFV